MTLNIVFKTLHIVFDIGPVLSALGGKLVNIQEFIDDIKAQLVELQTDAASEHEQVMAAIAALQAAVASTVPDSAKAEIDALFAATKTSISGVYEPAP